MVRYCSRRPDDGDLRRRLNELAVRFPRYGYRQLGDRLRRQGAGHNHKKIYRVYREGQKLMAVPVRTQPTFQSGSPQVLFEGPSWLDDITPDGQRFVMLQDSEEEAPAAPQIIYVPDFAEELKTKMAAADQ